MKSIFTLLCCLVSLVVSAQFTTVSHLSGTVTYGTTNVTVTPGGSTSSITYCGTSPYWIGSGGPGSFTFNFSPACNAFRVFISAANTGESITVAVNGSHYSLTTANVFAFTGTCGSATLLLSGDSLLCPTVAGSPGAAAGLNILQCGITSCTIATNGMMAGSVFTFQFSDTAGCANAYNNGPLCVGDTLRLTAVGAATDTFAWIGPGGFTSTLQNPTKAAVTYADSGMYRVIKNGHDTAYTRLIIKHKPVITATSNSPVCSASNILLDCGPDSVGQTYSWSGPGGFSTITRNPTIASATLADAGTYTVIADLFGCKDTASVFVDIRHVPIPVASNNTPICEGGTVSFTATDSLSGVTYSWTGPGGFTSTLQNPIIGSSTPANSGTYFVTVSILGCTAATTTDVFVNPVPKISGFTKIDPTPCYNSDGSITLTGLLPGGSYDVNYNFNGIPQIVIAVADGSGNIILTGLGAGIYTDMFVTAGGCPSNSVGPINLLDPGVPKAPVLSSNSPVCVGGTLALSAIDSLTGLTYSWSGPNGFVSGVQFPKLSNVTFADAGTFICTVSNGFCTNSASIDVVVIPGITLTNITDSQVIAFGGTVQLNALGAVYYAWTPEDGSIENPNINNPIARPNVTTNYQVIGMNTFGCKDTGYVYVDVTFPDTVFIPTAFTPNGDSKNDVFRITNPREYKLVDFQIFNRWGELVYKNSYNIQQGWDGSYKGVPQDIGSYTYLIILASPKGETKSFKGTVTLIR